MFEPFPPGLSFCSVITVLKYIQLNTFEPDDGQGLLGWPTGWGVLGPGNSPGSGSSSSSLRVLSNPDHGVLSRGRWQRREAQSPLVGIVPPGNEFPNLRNRKAGGERVRGHWKALPLGSRAQGFHPGQRPWYPARDVTCRCSQQGTPSRGCPVRGGRPGVGDWARRSRRRGPGRVPGRSGGGVRAGPLHVPSPPRLASGGRASGGGGGGSWNRRESSPRGGTRVGIRVLL